MITINNIERMLVDNNAEPVIPIVSFNDGTLKIESDDVNGAYVTVELPILDIGTIVTFNASVRSDTESRVALQTADNANTYVAQDVSKPDTNSEWVYIIVVATVTAKKRYVRLNLGVFESVGFIELRDYKLEIEGDSSLQYFLEKNDSSVQRFSESLLSNGVFTQEITGSGTLDQQLKFTRASGTDNSNAAFIQKVNFEFNGNEQYFVVEHIVDVQSAVKTAASFVRLHYTDASLQDRQLIIPTGLPAGVRLRHIISFDQSKAGIADRLEFRAGSLASFPSVIDLYEISVSSYNTLETKNTPIKTLCATVWNDAMEVFDFNELYRRNNITLVQLKPGGGTKTVQVLFNELGGKRPIFNIDILAGSKAFVVRIGLVDTGILEFVIYDLTVSSSVGMDVVDYPDGLTIMINGDA